MIVSIVNSNFRASGRMAIHLAGYWVIVSLKNRKTSLSFSTFYLVLTYIYLKDTKRIKLQVIIT